MLRLQTGLYPSVPSENHHDDHHPFGTKVASSEHHLGPSEGTCFLDVDVMTELSHPHNSLFLKQCYCLLCCSPRPCALKVPLASHAWQMQETSPLLGEPCLWLTVSPSVAVWSECFLVVIWRTFWFSSDAGVGEGAGGAAVTTISSVFRCGGHRRQAVTSLLWPRPREGGEHEHTCMLRSLGSLGHWSFPSTLWRQGLLFTLYTLGKLAQVLPGKYPVCLCLSSHGRNTGITDA